MYFFNTGLDFQSCFFDTYKLYIYIYVAPFVSNIFTSKSVLTIAETHTLWPIPHQGHLTHHHLSWDSLYSLVFFSHFLPKKAHDLKVILFTVEMGISSWDFVGKKVWDHRTIGLFLDGVFYPPTRMTTQTRKWNFEKNGWIHMGEVLRSPVCHTWHKMHKSRYIPAK